MKQNSRQLLLFLSLFFCASLVFAQERQVTGTVTDGQGNPIANASYLVKGTQNGGVTDEAGKFTVTVPGNSAVLVISSVNFASRELTVGNRSNIAITLEADNSSLTEVVVTALGIKREKKSLGYAVQEVKGESLVEAREPNLVNSLSGKIAGLQVIKSSNGPAGSSKIVLRGFNSLTGSNQPLIVVDGVPVDNFTGATNNDYWNPSLDMGNGLSDINAEDIASLSVLKGPSAAALYGNRAGNGVILITTKSGKRNKGLGLTLSSTIGIETIFSNPEMQNSFSQGANGIFDNRSNLSWGAKVEGQNVEKWNGETVPLQIFDNVDNYFDNGFSQNHNISFSQQFGQTSVYTSYNHFDDKSMIPGAKLTRDNLMARAVTKFGANEKWTTDTKIQYTNSVAKNRPFGGNNANNAFFALYMLPRSLDIRDFEAATNDAGSMLWYGGGNQVNPYWGSRYNLNQDQRDRFLLNGSLKYEFTSWLNAEIRGGADIYTTNSQSKLYAGSPLGASGRYGLGKDVFKETNYSTLISARKDEVLGKLGGAITLGGNLMSRKSTGLSANSGDLVVPNLFSLNNGVDKPTVSEFVSNRKTNSLFGTLQLNWDGYLYLDATLRNDWTSTLSKDNRSFSYPSLSLAYVITDMFNRMDMTTPGWLSYAKLRGSYAEVGNDLEPYQLYNTFGIGKDPNGNTTAFRNRILFDPNVRNELIKSYEFGAELRVLDNRVGFDISFYKSNATNQLINLPMDPLSGYDSKKINAGNVQNKGMELMADARIFDNPSAFNWTLGVNYSQNENRIIDLYEGITTYSLGGYDDLSILAVTGEKYGEIYGTRFVRVNDKGSQYNGQLLINGNGLPDRDPAIVRLGNQQATGLLGVTNTFYYKGIGLSFLVDARFGGQIFSGTNSEMQQNGTAAATVVNGERANMVVPGVVYDAATDSYSQNTKEVTPQQYWVAVAGAGNLGVTEANIYDASNVRLRHVQLSYELPRTFLGKTPFQSAKIGVSCNNVWLISSHLNGVDPESVFATGTNALGFENASPPTTRTFLMNLTLSF